jgi:hypothetical protein
LISSRMVTCETERLENEIFRQKLKTIDPEVAVRKLRRREKRLPENEGMYPNMQRINERLPERDSGSEDEDLQGEYVDPKCSDKRNGIQRDNAAIELPYKWVQPVEPVPKQNMPPLNQKPKKEMVGWDDD